MVETKKTVSIPFGKIAFGFFVLILLFSSVYTIAAGERGIVLTFQKPNQVPVEEGLHFKIPLVQQVVKMDIKTQKDEVDASAASSDLQTVSAKIAINYHIESDSVVDIYQGIGLNYADRVLNPAIQEATKASTAQFTAEELITKREIVREQILTLLREKMASKGIVIENVLITNFDFSESFNQAIESKVSAEQNALAAKNKLEQIKYEAEQRIVQANAEAEAISIQAAAIQSQGGQAYVQLQFINKWDGRLSQYSGGGVIPFLNINQQAQTTA